MAEYCTFYNERRPRRGPRQQCPVPLAPDSGTGRIARDDVLAGIIHDYYREVA